MDRQRKQGWGLLFAACCFLWNPVIGVTDILPDAVGYLLLMLGLACAVMAAGELHGNAKSRIYHNSSCRYYTCRNCTVVFASAQEARAAGFRACKICGG